MAKQEVKPCEFANGVCIHCEATERENCECWICPPQREWVGLTEEDFVAINQSCLTKFQAAMSAESILKERNK